MGAGSYSRLCLSPPVSWEPQFPIHTWLLEPGFHHHSLSTLAALSIWPPPDLQAQGKGEPRGVCPRHPLRSARPPLLPSPACLLATPAPLCLPGWGPIPHAIPEGPFTHGLHA